MRMFAQLERLIAIGKIGDLNNTLIWLIGPSGRGKTQWLPT
jgi:hypothetical protein